MMDEKLIGEVQQHCIIYNRQKSNTIFGDKCMSKELAWQDIARNLGSDVDTCKKRWKYLRERYVQQKKVGGDSPSFEHLSRPYLEKMKFLDSFIQPRKSYRQVGHFTSPNSTHRGFDGNDSSKSNGSMRMNGLKMDNDDSFSQYYHINAFPHANLVVKMEDGASNDDLNGKISDNMRQTGNNNNMVQSSSSSLASQASPHTLISNNSTTHENDDSPVSRKRRRIAAGIDTNERNNSNDLNNLSMEHSEQQILNISSDNDDDDDDDEVLDDEDEDQNSINNGDHGDDDTSEHHQTSSANNDNLYSNLYNQNSARFRKSNDLNPSTSTFSNAADFLHPLYQQAIARQLRNSDQLLGELVTSELIKMPKDRKKAVQKKILEILFFDDE